MILDELLRYQEADGKLRAVEQAIAATEERKKYASARKFLEKAPEKLEALDAKAVELRHMFEQLEKKYAELADTIKDYENLDEMIGEQGGEISFYKKSAQQISDNLRGLKNEINRLISLIAEIAKSVPKDQLEKYKAKRKEKMYPVVCEVKGNRCSQCGMELSIAELSKLASGNAIECDSCHRTLFQRK